MRLKKIHLLFLVLLTGLRSFAQTVNPQIVSQIAFGSCNSENDAQEIWYSIMKEDPQLFIFLGDNIYGDTKDMNVLQAKYNQLGNKPGYKALKQKTDVLATWDDHDYGKNDAGKEYKMKEQSKEIFLKFFNEPDTSARWKHKGIYHSLMYGVDGKKLQIILLDTRTFRDKLLRVRADLACKGPYAKLKNKHKTFLGEEQWKWLEEELKKPADLRLIATSTQFLVDFNGWEAWINMPHERERMMQLIEKTKANGVFFISGDVHYAELSRLKRDGCYPLYDLTSSGLTHGHSCDGGNKNRIEQIFMEANYGLITIDWNNEQGTKLLLNIKDKNGQTKISHAVSTSELTF